MTTNSPRKRALSLRVLLVCMAASMFALVLGCVSGGSGGTPSPTGAVKHGEGIFAVHLLDAPVDAKEVWVSINGLSARMCGEDWVSVPVSEAQFDLLSLTNGAWGNLVTDAALPAGKYCELRLQLGSDNRIVFKDNSSADLKVPSGSSSGLKLKGQFDIIPAIRTTMTLDFDADKSIHQAGNSGKYVLEPVIEIVRTTYRALDERPLPAGDFLDSAEHTVSPQGGSFPVGGGSFITFPPGAVPSDFTFTVSRWHVDSPVILSDTFVFQPRYMFETAVQLEIPYDAANVDADAEVFVRLDHEKRLTTLNAGIASAMIEHFCDTDVRDGAKESPERALSPSNIDDRHLLRGQVGACLSTVLQQDYCSGDALPGKPVTIDCNSNVQAFIPGCTEISYENLGDLDANTARIRLRASFFLTEEELNRVGDFDSSIEWQLKFFKTNAAHLVTEFEGMRTNLPGTVADSPCFDDFLGVSATEDAASLVTLCPFDLNTYTKYFIEFDIRANKTVLTSPGSIPRSFALDVIPGRLCELANGVSSLRSLCSGDMSEVVQKSSLIVTDSNFSWNCKGLNGRIVDGHLSLARDMGACDPATSDCGYCTGANCVNEVPMPSSPVAVVAHNERVPEYQGEGASKTIVDEPRKAIPGTTCAPHLDNFSCTTYERGKFATCFLTGGPFVERRFASYQPETHCVEPLPVWVGNMDPSNVMLLDPNTASVSGTWACNSGNSIDVAYRQPGVANRDIDSPDYKFFSQNVGALWGTCVYGPPAPNCAGKTDGPWCSTDDTAVVECLGGSVDPNVSPKQCDVECVSMANGQPDECWNEFCAGKVAGWWCMGIEPKRVYCDGAGGAVFLQECPAGCAVVKGDHDHCK